MPSTGYHNDQFFNLQGESVSQQAIGKKDGVFVSTHIKADNPPFIYPSRTIRTDDNTGSKNVELQRGYIRSMVTNSESLSTGIRKCQFQFNPSTLQQSVSMASGMLNIMQQDPAQFAQPMAASQNFSFTLMFDRSMEINNDSGALPPLGADADIWSQASPGQVGVLRDLAALFHTVGQGFTLQQRDYIAKVLQDTVTAESLGANAPEDAATQLANATTNINDTSSSGFLNINIGNAAFLLPVPVRVVFSSLYVVEGLVTNTSVVFTKFSTRMVPMQCVVTLTMEAKYIGFSKQKTFFTEVLRQREALELENKQQAAAELAALTDAFTKMMARLHVKAVTMAGPDIANADPTVSQLLTSQRPSAVVTVVPHPAADTSQDADPVYSLLDGSGVDMQISVNAELTIYGPFSSFNVGTSPSQQAIITQVRGYGSPEVFSSMITSSDGYQVYADSASTWRHMVDGGSSSPHTFKGTATYDSSKYYVISVSADVRVTSGGNTLTAIGDGYSIVPPATGTSRKAAQSVLMTWPKAPVTSGTVPASNQATTPPTGTNNPTTVAKKPVVVPTTSSGSGSRLS